MIDDDSLLSAYLDGELDPAARLDVESASMTDPRLAEELHELACVQDLLAGLSRPGTPRDLALAVCARIDGQRVHWTERGAFVPAVAAAAALLIAVPLGWLWFANQEREKPVRPLIAAKGPATTPTSPQPAPIVAERAETDKPRAEDAIKETAPEVGRMAVRDEDPEAKAREDAQAHIRKMLDSPNLHRVYIVTDVIGNAAGRLDALLQQTPRGEPRYGRITVCHEIVIDPKHPDQATVFALVMNDRELRQFQAQLKETFPQNVEETIAEPSVVTQLADIGQVAVLSGIAAPDVTIPAAVPSRLALRAGAGEKALQRTRVSPGADFDELAGAGLRGSNDPPRRGAGARIVEGPRHPQGESAPLAAGDSPASPAITTAKRESSDGHRQNPEPLAAVRGSGRGDAEGRGEPSIVLVWVTTRERRGGDPPSGPSLEPPGAGG